MRELRLIPVERLASDPGARAGLVALRHSHAGGEEDKLRLLPEVVAGPPDNSEFEKQVLLYLMGIWNVPVRTLEKVAEQAKPGRGKAVVGQVVEEIRNRGKAEWLAKGEAKGLAKGLAKGEAKGEAKGLAKGEAKGLAKGEAKGLARALRRLLERRFGPLPPAVRTRIAGASASDLDVGFAAALDAESLSAVFPDLGLD